MKKFIERLFWLRKAQKSHDFIQNIASDNAFSISSTVWNSQVQRLKTAFIEYETACYTSFEILTIFANKFATSDLEEYLIDYLRACLQLLFIYSIRTGDKEWTLQKGIITFENHAARLEKVLQIPRMFISSQFSLENCLLRANLLERNAELACVRVSIIRWLYDLSQTIEPGIRFEAYDHKDPNHVRNALNFYKKTEDQISTLQFNKYSFQFSDQSFTSS